MEHWMATSARACHYVCVLFANPGSGCWN